MKLINLEGMKFGKWTVLEKVVKSRKVYWKCKCDCGIEKDVRSEYLRSGKSASCGTCNKVKYKPDDIHYGRAAAILQRCYDENHIRYKDYGGRGITCFTRDIQELVECLHNIEGFKEGMSIDRIDNNGNYEPNNLRWADWITQNNNKNR